MVVLDEPSGAACIPGGLCPCGLSAGAPPVVVSIGPVQPCGCFCPFASGEVRPLLCCEASDGLFGGCACASTIPAEQSRQAAASAMRIVFPRFDQCQRPASHAGSIRKFARLMIGFIHVTQFVASASLFYGKLRQRCCFIARACRLPYAR